MRRKAEERKNKKARQAAAKHGQKQMFSWRLMKRPGGEGEGEGEEGDGGGGDGTREESEKRVGRAKRRKIDVKRNGKGVKQSVTGRTKWVISRWPMF